MKTSDPSGKQATPGGRARRIAQAAFDWLFLALAAWAAWEHLFA